MIKEKTKALAQAAMKLGEARTSSQAAARRDGEVPNMDKDDAKTTSSMPTSRKSMTTTRKRPNQMIKPPAAQLQGSGGLPFEGVRA